MTMDNLILGTRVSGCTRRIHNRTFFERNTLQADIMGLSLIILLKGRVRVTLKAATFCAGPYDAVVIAPGDAYSFEMIPGTRLSYYNVGLAPVTASGIMASRERLGLAPLCRLPHTPAAARLCRELFTAFKRKGDYSRQQCSMLGLRLLLLLKPADEPVPVLDGEADARPAAERIRDMLDYIRTHYKERLTVGGLAGMVAMHPSRFSRLFSAMTGVSPQRYIQEKKVLKAKDFLLEHHASLTLTAQELGFHDYSHFFKVFRKIEGISPKQFLQKNR